MPISADEFRHALGGLAAGVTVVTAATSEGLAGITVTSFTSLSLRPPQILICIGHHAWMHDRLPLQSAFAVNILSAEQESVSQRFAKRGGDPFAEIGHSPSPLGAPLIHGASVGIECSVVERLPGGDHTIVVGEVQSATVGDDRPLVYYRGKYSRLA